MSSDEERELMRMRIFEERKAQRKPVLRNEYLEKISEMRNEYRGEYNSIRAALDERDKRIRDLSVQFDKAVGRIHALEKRLDAGTPWATDGNNRIFGPKGENFECPEELAERIVAFLNGNKP